MSRAPKKTISGVANARCKLVSTKSEIEWRNIIQINRQYIIIMAVVIFFHYFFFL